MRARLREHWDIIHEKLKMPLQCTFRCAIGFSYFIFSFPENRTIQAKPSFSSECAKAGHAASWGLLASLLIYSFLRSLPLSSRRRHHCHSKIWKIFILEIMPLMHAIYSINCKSIFILRDDDIQVIELIFFSHIRCQRNYKKWCIY